MYRSTLDQWFDDYVFLLRFFSNECRRFCEEKIQFYILSEKYSSWWMYMWNIIKYIIAIGIQRLFMPINNSLVRKKINNKSLLFLRIKCTVNLNESISADANLILNAVDRRTCPIRWKTFLSNNVCINYAFCVFHK